MKRRHPSYYSKIIQVVEEGERRLFSPTQTFGSITCYLLAKYENDRPLDITTMVFLLVTKRRNTLFEKMKLPDADRRYNESRGEAITRETLEDIYGVPFISCRPDFMLNTETGETMELDCYNDELKLAAEYNGVQHYEWPNYTKQSKKHFIRQVRRDQLKKDICDQYGIYLISIPYNVELERIPEFVRHWLPEAVIKRERRRRKKQNKIR